MNGKRRILHIWHKERAIHGIRFSTWVFRPRHNTRRRVVERQPILSDLGDDVPLHAHVEVIDGYRLMPTGLR